MSIAPVKVRVKTIELKFYVNALGVQDLNRAMTYAENKLPELVEHAMNDLRLKLPPSYYIGVEVESK